MCKVGRNIESFINCHFGAGAPKAPPPPPPPPAREDAAAAAQKQAMLNASKSGRQSTILTSGLGTMGGSTGSAVQKTLLGG